MWRVAVWRDRLALRHAAPARPRAPDTTTSHAATSAADTAGIASGAGSAMGRVSLGAASSGLLLVSAAGLVLLLVVVLACSSCRCSGSGSSDAGREGTCTGALSPSSGASDVNNSGDVLTAWNASWRSSSYPSGWLHILIPVSRRSVVS